jgi:hypothetical protein
MKNLHMYDFGIFIELEPDEEEKAMLENNIQAALQQQNIELEDAIDLRMIKNTKLANQMLKLRRVKKAKQDHRRKLEETQAQGQAQAQASQAQAKAEIQKNQAVTENQIKLEAIKTDGKSQLLAQEASIKQTLMEQEFQYNMQLQQIQVAGEKLRDETREDRKDQRTKIQATQQSELIDQRKNEKPPKNFESTGNDVLGGLNLGAFEPS